MLNLELEINSEFRETNNGILAGMSNDIANQKYPGLFWNSLEWDEHYPQGESPQVFFERIKTGWKLFSDIIIRDNKNTVLVTHGGVINVIFHLIRGTKYSNKENPERISYATMIPIEYTEGVWKEY